MARNDQEAFSGTHEPGPEIAHELAPENRFPLAFGGVLREIAQDMKRRLAACGRFLGPVRRLVELGERKVGPPGRVGCFAVAGELDSLPEVLLGIGNAVLEKGDLSELLVRDGEVFRSARFLGELQPHLTAGGRFAEIAPPQVKLRPAGLQAKAIPPLVPVVPPKEFLDLEKTGFGSIELTELESGESHVEPGVGLPLQKPRLPGDAGALFVHPQGALEIEGFVVHPADAVRESPEPEQVVVLLGGAASVLESRDPLADPPEVRLREPRVK